ncbi:MAG: MaoC family dehydratase N-terminal domain-containing protein [Proteobacteria bacterium]|nr:MaoC family dehydratase N-terminal domain-containing protein [Pseudomonadota bacterium]
MKKEKSVLPEAELTNEMLEEYKDRVGLELRVSNVFNQTVSYEAVRNYVNGIGDYNFLYRDREYAKKSRYEELVAPPNWLYSVFPTYVVEGLPGLHAWHSGNDWEFYKPIYINDCIKPKSTIIGFDILRTKFSGKSLWRYQKAEFFNQRGELVARAYSWSLRGERRVTRKTGKYSQLRLPHPWTEEELTKIESDILDEEIRGSEVRYWEDVKEGDELPPVIKGPFGLTDMIAYCVGATPVQLAAHGVQLRNYRNHPAWAFRDPDTMALEPIYGVHYNKLAAQSAGLPIPYTAGVQNQSWLINLLTNWMGDEGWIKRNYAEYRRFVYFSDVVWLKGKVVKKYVDENSEHCVDIRCNGINQRREDIIPSFATIILPSKEKGEWPVARRLPAQKFRGSGK